jgi:hypothetical protein
MSEADAPLRILHLPDVIGGHPPALARGERSLGAVATTLSCEPSVYGYPADIMLGATSDSLRKKVIDRWRAFRQVRGAYDIFHFNFGASLLSFPRYGAIVPELAHYGRRAARFMTWQGDDARLTYPDVLERSMEEERRLGRWAGPMRADQYVDRARLLKRRIAISRSAKACHHMFALNPDLLAHLPARQTSFLPYAIEPPTGFDLPAPNANRPAGRPLRLVHLSTSPIIKGTGLIERAVDMARREVDVDLDLVVQQPRPDALRRLARADYMIDQLVLGWYGGTVVEAMYLGVPAIGRICPVQRAAAGELGRELPVIEADADTLTEVIIRLARDREARSAHVERGLAFAQKWHRPEAVAATTLAAYQRVLGQVRG